MFKEGNWVFSCFVSMQGQYSPISRQIRSDDELGAHEFVELDLGLHDLFLVSSFLRLMIFILTGLLSIFFGNDVSFLFLKR